MAENKNKKSNKEEMVTIRIPQSREDKEDVVVWLNDRRFLIKRGASVKVPIGVAEILEHQEEMIQRIYELESQGDRNEKQS